MVRGLLASGMLHSGELYGWMQSDNINNKTGKCANFWCFFANKVRHKKMVDQPGKMKHDQPNIQRVVTSSSSLPVNYTHRQPLE